MGALRVRRVILFARNLERLLHFYRDVLGLRVRTGSADEGWVDFGTLALHRGASRTGSTKVAFWSANVARDRERLVRRGARLGRVKDFGGLVLCEGLDPEGNRYQLSSRP